MPAQLNRKTYAIYFSAAKSSSWRFFAICHQRKRRRLVSINSHVVCFGAAKVTAPILEGILREALLHRGIKQMSKQGFIV
ncbi:hypothetical protein [Saccharophagus sp. K07]|uniref:hypothetical protein n=1 Tax=Saccharophagus sp. K07 TaxID=2283636 RepID=UPI0016521F8D|nr:hypothetical protein [Saccharophagus sp. K07]